MDKETKKKLKEMVKKTENKDLLFWEEIPMQDRRLLKLLSGLTHFIFEDYRIFIKREVKKVYVIHYGGIQEPMPFFLSNWS